ncbi:hypothetical protein [Nostoc sp.]|uniref:hypothetical protein n=1 Tax=Nostoc sp. TaxID=1180 RepID=UPI002FF6EC9C
MIISNARAETHDEVLESRKQFFIDEMIEALGYTSDHRPRLEDIFEAIYGKPAIEEPKVYANFLLCLMGK